MSFPDAAHVLDELDSGRIPDLGQALRSLQALDPLLLRGGCEPELHDAAATLELLVATGGTVDLLTAARTRAKAMADAVRRVIVDA